MSQNFKVVTSEIKGSSDAQAKFIFGDELMQQNKVTSIAPKTPDPPKLQQPTFVEVWVFELEK